jgi:hypothetical protein
VTAPVRVWQSWTAGNPEPDGLTIVRDNSGIVSYTDSPEWKRDIKGEWQGYKGGEKVWLDWAELLNQHGPVTGAVGPQPKLEDPTPASLYFGVIPA